MQIRIPLVLTLLGLGIATSGCSRWARQVTSEETFIVAVPYLPNQLDPRSTLLSAFYYMVLQLYYPLLSRNVDTGAFESEFLDMTKTRSLATSMDRYCLCLKAGLAYDDGAPVRVEDLYSSLQDLHGAHAIYPKIISAEVDGSCVNVVLGEPDIRYLDKLTLVGSTILRSEKEAGPFPVGMGPYGVDVWNEQRVSFIYRGKRKGVRFQRIDFIKADSLKEAVARKAHDTNMLAYWDPNRDELLRDYSQVKHVILRTHALYVSHPDDELRKAFIRAFSTKKFSDYLPLKHDALPGYLPAGVPGYSVDFDPIKASFPTKNPGAQKPLIRFFNTMPEAQVPLEKFFEEEAGRLPMKVKVELRKREELLSTLQQGVPLLYLFGTDSSGAQVATLDDQVQYFQNFFSTTLLGGRISTSVERAMRNAVFEVSSDKKASLYEAAHREILSSGWIIPLGQMPSVLYYPRTIKHIPFTNTVGVYPRIDLIGSGDSR